MSVSQKCQYALRAMLELAMRQNDGPTRIADIAETQAIPVRFLEVILSQLKQGGFVESRRGSEGGYMLAREPAAISVGDVIRFVDGPIAPVKCIEDAAQSKCPLKGNCAFASMWEEAREALSAVYDRTTLRDVAEREKKARGTVPLNFSI